MGRTLSEIEVGNRGPRLDHIYVGLFCKPAQKWRSGGQKDRVMCERRRSARLVRLDGRPNGSIKPFPFPVMCNVLHKTGKGLIEPLEKRWWACRRPA